MENNDKKTNMIKSSIGWLYAAEGFIKAGAACNNGNGLDYFRYYIAPRIVNYSLACELLLKLLYSTTNNGEYPQKHCLMEIYEKIDSRILTELNFEYQNQSDQYKRQYLLPEQEKLILSLEGCIKKHTRSFVEWRYLFESKNGSISAESTSLYLLAISLLAVAKRHVIQEC